MTQPIDTIPVIDVDQAFPLLTSDGGGRRSSSGGDGNGGVTPAVEGAIRDVLGWRPRAQNTAAFTAALSASFQLDEVEGHVVSTYRARGFAMQADLGAVSGGQASLYTRAVAARTQMLQLLDGLVPLRPDADLDDCEAFRGLVRDAVNTMIAELGTPGGPRVAVVNAYLRQLLGVNPKPAATGTINADNVDGQLGAIRIQFGLEDIHVNSPDEEGIRTAFWTLVDLVTDINRSWVNLRAEFSGKRQHGFLGTQLVLVNQLLSAAAEQVDEVEAALDSVFVSAAERQTIKLPNRNGMTLDGLLTWTRTFVTEEGPRIARDAGRDGMATSFTPTVMDITSEMAVLMGTIGRPTIVLPPSVQAWFANQTPAGSNPVSTAVVRPGRAPRPPRPNYSIQVPLISVGAQAKVPPGLQSSRARIAVSGLFSLLNNLANLAIRISRYPGVVLFDAAILTSSHFPETMVTVRGLNLQRTFQPVFRDPLVRAGRRARAARGNVKAVPVVNPVDNLAPLPDRTSYEDDTISAVFHSSDLDDWLTAYDDLHQPSVSLAGLAMVVDGVQILQASDFPVKFVDNLTGKRVRGVQTRP